MPSKPNTKLLLILFLLSAACDNNAQTATKLDYPEVTSARFAFYKEKCGVCHAAPLPARFTAKQWPQIIDRMQLRMIRISIKPLDDPQKSRILGYLQEYAKS